MMKRLDGIVAIITGAAGGIGEAICRLFYDEGARIVLADVAEQPLAAIAAGLGPRATSAACDVSSAASVHAMVQHAIQVFGSIHVLVNNAAAYQNDGTLMAVSEDTWDRIMAVNVKGPWLCMREAVPAMREAGGGSIINIGSVNGSFGLSLTAYSASKGGLAALTRVAAIELGPSNIRVNTICPGTIMTPASVALYAERPGLKEAVTAMYPMGKLGEVQDVANCALYLASKESKFVTGATFTVDGGLTAGRTFDLNYVKEP
ncbi:MAG: SDR family oxidoreductase [Bryobacteraceae bacterium]